LTDGASLFYGRARGVGTFPVSILALIPFRRWLERVAYGTRALAAGQLLPLSEAGGSFGLGGVNYGASSVSFFRAEFARRCHCASRIGLLRRSSLEAADRRLE
jgi:hypothetical protein